ncbi:DUF4188 domain-containing protein [Winogradskyella sp. 3972H.M.0a.05]|uniref:antibiotic biosynthesis monooxygenase family protein n=1 Tax=Winogradskyella sp. 3972H.M.0a.05 TaxID=2950277 RepID=UPI003390FE69
MNTDFKPYYAVIFTSTLVKPSEVYNAMAQRMAELSKQQPGFISMDSARSDVGITICYWESLEAIEHWKRNAEHREAQHRGITEWYKYYNVRICKVEREYEFNR